MKSGDGKPDRYEQILTRYDWRAERPPRGYQYGIGRGAKAFVTTAELSTATTTQRPTAEEAAFFDTLEQLEEQRRRVRHDKTRDGDEDDGDVNETQSRRGHVNSAPVSSAAHKHHSSVLSLDDIATVQASRVGGAAALVPRSARSEAAEQAETYVFADERVVTAQDVLRGKLHATESSLQSILAMGSPEEQTTWITHARAYREMGMLRRALQTLEEGCALTGHKGSRIWLERLSLLPRDQHPAARRRLLETATEACPGAVELWLELLDCEPAQDRLHWLQRAVIACPASEPLWLRVLQHVPEARDQRRIIQKALQRTPQLPRLWSRLARLEETPEAGRAIFRAAALQYPSFDLVIEAAKYAEYSALKAWRVACHIGGGQQANDFKSCTATLTRRLRDVQRDLDELVRTARERYLDMREEASRHRWLAAAAAAAVSTSNADVAPDAPYTCVSALLYVYAVLPPKRTLQHVGDFAVETALQDLMAFVPQAWSSHAVLCALWVAWLLLMHVQSMAGVQVEERLIQAIVRAAIDTAPEEVLSDPIDILFAQPMPTSVGPDAGALHTAVASSVTRHDDDEEEEEEELLTAQALSSAPAAASSSMTSSLPPSLVTALLQSVCDDITDADTASPCSVGLLLDLAEALSERGHFNTVLHLLHGPIARRACAVGDAVRVQVAIAKAYAALGRDDEAERCLRQQAALHLPGPDGELAWCKLAIHCRHRGGCNTALVELLTTAIADHPRSGSLWLMRLECALMMTAAADSKGATRDSDTVDTQSGGGGGGKNALALDATMVRQLRALCERALTEAHCRHEASVWAFVAVRVESGLLHSAASARALLLDAHAACCPSAGGVLPGGGAMTRAAQEALVLLGVARAEVELRHGSVAAAHEVVRETLQRLPKTREGQLTVAAGKLLALFIDLEAPAARGRAAAQVMKQWKSRDPLALAAVAKLYHAARHYERALEQAIKAVTTERGRHCGDCVALLWKLALRPEYAALVGPRLVPPVHVEGGDGSEVARLPEEAVREWVWRTACESRTHAEDAGTDEPQSTATAGGAKAAVGETRKPEVNNSSSSATTAVAKLRLDCGPLWDCVSTIDDPTNVTLLGFRDSTEAMLRRVMERIEL